MFARPRKSRSTSGSTSDSSVNRGFWWFGCLYFCHFFNVYVFRVEEFIFFNLTILPCLGDLENPG